MSTLDRATTIAAEFNRQHSDVQLQVVQTAAPLTPAEVKSYGTTPHGWLLPGQVFFEVRGRKATHSEAISAGRTLSAIGYPTQKMGPHRLYRLDNSQLVDAD